MNLQRRSPLHNLNTLPSAQVIELEASTAAQCREKFGTDWQPEPGPRHFANPFTFSDSTNRLDCGIDPDWGKLRHRLMHAIRSEQYPERRRLSSPARGILYGFLIQAAAVAIIVALWRLR